MPRQDAIEPAFHRSLASSQRKGNAVVRETTPPQPQDPQLQVGK
jgi:hypothetical protein